MQDPDRQTQALAMTIASHNLFVTVPSRGASNSLAENRTRIGVLTQLYIWSIIFEPLLLFVIGSQATTGVGLNFGRLMQVLVLTGLMLRFVMNPASVRISNPFNDRLRPYFLFIFYTIFAGVLGLLLDKYVYFGQVVAGQSVLALINTPLMRPIWEYVTLIFQFTYFILLAPYFMRGEREVSYFFKVFTVMAMIQIILGWIDFVLAGIGVDLIPRHLSDWRHVGVRFHGVAGEPRDAFVYMIAILFMFGLKSMWVKGRVDISKGFFAIIVFSLIAMLLIAVFGFNKISPKRIAGVLAIIVLGLGLVYIAFATSERLQEYMSYFEVVQRLFLDSNVEVPFLVMIQYNNIYPIIELYRDIMNNNPLPLIFGSGLGSSGFANSRTGLWETFLNPHSQITRILFETGLLGTLLFIYAVRTVLLNSTLFFSRFNQQYLLWLFLLLLGCYFAHRSTHLVICIGVLYAVTQQMRKRPEYLLVSS
jgi:hypothetical protein